MAVSANDTDRIEQLKARRAGLEARIAKITASRRRAGGALDPDFAEQAVQRENDEVLDALDDTERRELGRIQDALKRIDAGCFGICDDCGNEIDPNRLDVAPEAARCIGCEQARETAQRQGE